MCNQYPMNSSSLLPAATKLWPRLCFYTCLWFCSQGGGSPENPLPPWPGRPPPGTRQTHPCDQAYPPGPGRPPPGTRQTPPRDQGDPPGPRRTPPPPPPPPGPRWTPPPPGRTLQHTVNERPVRILLECILVFIGKSKFNCNASVI